MTTAKGTASKPPGYAEKTKVSVAKSQMDITAMLKKYGTPRAIGEDPDLHAAVIAFIYGGYSIRIFVRMPERDAFPSQAAYEQAERQRWREMYLLVKAKLVAVAGGHRTIEEEFLGDIVLPGDESQTFSQWYAPQLRHLAAHNRRPPLLPGLSQLQLPPGQTIDKSE